MGGKAGIPCTLLHHSNKTKILWFLEKSAPVFPFFPFTPTIPDPASQIPGDVIALRNKISTFGDPAAIPGWKRPSKAENAAEIN